VKGLRITYNAPVVLSFALAAVVVQLLVQYVSKDIQLWFAAWPQIHDTRSYAGMVTHVLGHANWDHLLGNFAMILLIGPILEERHGSFQLLVMCLITAFVTGLVNIVFTDSFLVGASGIVFMMIVLSSMANIRHREIPLTFIAVAVLFLGREVISAFEEDNISQMGHLIGGAAGAAFGFASAKAHPEKLLAESRGKPAMPVAAAPTPSKPAPKPAAKPAPKPTAPKV
jgi:membrane associated rhomboid family serine protease